MICTICDKREIDGNCKVEYRMIGGSELHDACLCKPCYDEFIKTGKFTEFHRK